jgi:hypothetical protein
MQAAPVWRIWAVGAGERSISTRIGWRTASSATIRTPPRSRPRVVWSSRSAGPCSSRSLGANSTWMSSTAHRWAGGWRRRSRQAQSCDSADYETVRAAIWLFVEESTGRTGRCRSMSLPTWRARRPQPLLCREDSTGLCGCGPAHVSTGSTRTPGRPSSAPTGRSLPRVTGWAFGWSGRGCNAPCWTNCPRRGSSREQSRSRRTGSRS